MKKTKTKKIPSSFGATRKLSGAPDRREAGGGGDGRAPLWLAGGLWLSLLAGLLMCGLHVAKGESVADLLIAEPASGPLEEGATSPLAADPLQDPDADLLARPEDRAVLSYYCGPGALSWALERLARRQKVAAFDRERAFQRAAELSQPLPGRGTSLLDLKRAASRIAPARVEGVRFASGENLLDLLRDAPGSSAVIHLDPVAERQLTPQPTGHFVSLAFVPLSEEEKKNDSRSRPSWRWFDPAEAMAGDPEARAGRKIGREELEKRLDESSSGYALLLFP